MATMQCKRFELPSHSLESTFSYRTNTFLSIGLRYSTFLILCYTNIVMENTSQTQIQQKDNPFLRRITFILLLLLLIQFVDGIVVNLYTNLPKIHPGAIGSYAPSIPWALSGGAGIALAIHIANWLLLMVIGITSLIIAITTKRKAFIIGSSFGFFFILVAASGGLTFLNRGGNNIDSLQMAIAFILSFISYALILYKTK